MVRTRFAPSPTGYLHIGGVRTALFNWLFARQQGGQFLLRIDDTDEQRNIQDALQPILNGFRWLGIDWDEGPEVGGPYAPYYQSQRKDRYRSAVEKLLADGFAYRDYARTEEVQQERSAAEREKRSFVYSRRWMADDDATAARFGSEGRQSVVRLKMPRGGSCRFRDLVRGDVEFAWQAEQDHVVQLGADGSVLYHLASVVDDADFHITHVIRAEEHLSNTARQIFIAQSLGYDLPHYAHLPYVAEPGSRNKLSKRKLSQYMKHPDFKKLYEHGRQIAAQLQMQAAPELFNPVLVDFYRDVGYLPDALLNYLMLLGWSLDDRTEDFSRAMIQHFSLDRVHKAPASFDPQKLWAFQQRHMQSLPVKQKVPLVLPFLQRAGLVPSPPPCEIGPRLTQVVQAAGDRIKVAGDILEFAEFFVADEQLVYDEKAFDKRLRKPGVTELLGELNNRFGDTEPFDAASLEAHVQQFVEEHGIQIGDIIHALRVAVTGKPVGLGMFDALAILGREASRARVQRAISKANTA